MFGICRPLDELFLTELLSGQYTLHNWPYVVLMADSDGGGGNSIDDEEVPDWVDESSKEVIYWRTLYEAKQEETKDARHQLADHTETWTQAFQEGIRSMGWNMSTSQAIPKTGWGDVNVGVTAENVISGISPVLSLATAGAGIGGFLSDSISVALSLALIGISLGTGLSWYYYEFHREKEQHPADRIPNRASR